MRMMTTVTRIRCERRMAVVVLGMGGGRTAVVVSIEAGVTIVVLEPPVLEEIGTRFRVTLPAAARVAAPSLDKTDQAILDALDEDGLVTSEIARVVQLTTRATRSRLARLAERGLVRRVGTSPQDPKRRYYRAT